MNQSFSINLTQFGIIIFSLAVLMGPLYTTPSYSVVSNLISELASQKTHNNAVMMTAFVIFGSSLVVAGIHTFKVANIPILAFGFSMILAGLFGHKPILPDISYNLTLHNIHSVMANAAGIFITLAFIWRIFEPGNTPLRFLSALFAILCIALPLLMMLFPNVQGLIQRLMYASVFTWLWFFYPTG